MQQLPRNEHEKQNQKIFFKKGRVFQKIEIALKVDLIEQNEHHFRVQCASNTLDRLKNL